MQITEFPTNLNQDVETKHPPGFPKADPGLPLTIAHLQHEDVEATVDDDDAVCLVLVLSERHFVERRRGGVWSRRPARIGNITVTNPDEVTAFAMRGRINVFKLLVPVAGLAAAAGSGRRPKVIARFGDPEPELGRRAQRAPVALHQGEGSDRLLLSSIVMRLHARLAELSASGSGRAVGGLAPRQMRRVQELIEACASAPIASSPSLAELAAETNLSVHHSPGSSAGAPASCPTPTCSGAGWTVRASLSSIRASPWPASPCCLGSRPPPTSQNGSVGRWA